MMADFGRIEDIWMDAGRSGERVDILCMQYRRLSAECLSREIS